MTTTPQEQSHSVAQPELRRSALSPLLLKLCRVKKIRQRTIELALRLEGGMFYSATARDALDKLHGVRIGAYSYGDCFESGAFPAGTTIGRYVSIAKGVRVFLRNHPMERLSLHPFFYSALYGFVEKDTIDAGTLDIGHDAWLGERAIITPGCSHIGVGAVIGAGAVVTRDVPDFAIVAGNPAKFIRFRFDEAMREHILASRWWELSIEQCAQHIASMVKPIPDDPTTHPLLGAKTGTASACV